MKLVWRDEAGAGAAAAAAVAGSVPQSRSEAWAAANHYVVPEYMAICCLSVAMVRAEEAYQSDTRAIQRRFLRNCR